MANVKAIMLRARQAAKRSVQRSRTVYSTDPEVKLELQERRKKHERRKQSEIRKLYLTETSRGRSWHDFLV